MSRLQDVILRGTSGAQPAAASVPIGTLYYSTDLLIIQRSNGATWEIYSPTAGASVISTSAGQGDGGGDGEADIFVPSGPYGLTKAQISKYIASTDLSNGADIPLLDAYNVWTGRQDFGASFAMDGFITPTALSGNTDDWNPTGLVNADVIRISTAAGASYNLTGIDVSGASITTGYLILLVNINTTGDITLKHETTSSVNNRFRCANATDYILKPGASVWIWRDTTSNKWQVDNTYVDLSAAGGTSVANLHWSAANINSMNSSPQQIIAGQGATKVVIPLMGTWRVVRTANVFSADPSFKVRYVGDTTGLLGTQPSFFLASAGPDSQYRDSLAATFNFGGGGFDPRNKAIEMVASADTTGGSGATMDFSMGYYIATLS